MEKRQQLGTLGKHNNAIWALAFSRDGVLASGSSDTTAKLWHVANKKLIATLRTSDRKRIWGLAYSPDGKIVALAKDQTIQICDAKTGDLLRVLRGHTGGVSSLAFSPIDNTLASGSADETVKLWDPATGKIKQTLAGRKGDVFGARLHNGRQEDHGRWRRIRNRSIRCYSPASGEFSRDDQARRRSHSRPGLRAGRPSRHRWC